MQHPFLNCLCAVASQASASVCSCCGAVGQRFLRHGQSGRWLGCHNTGGRLITFLSYNHTKLNLHMQSHTVYLSVGSLCVGCRQCLWFSFCRIRTTEPSMASGCWWRKSGCRSAIDLAIAEPRRSPARAAGLHQSSYSFQTVCIRYVLQWTSDTVFWVAGATVIS